MANVIEVIIRATDEASAKIKAIGTSLNTFAGQFAPVQRATASLDGLKTTMAGVASAGGPLASSANAAAGAIGSITPASIAAGVAIAGIGTAALLTTKAIIDAAIEGGRFADDMGTLAERAGVTSEAFSKLAFAAGQFDASTASVSSALKFLSRNIFEARNGMQEAEDSFNALGLSVEELARLDADEAFLRVADALSRVQNQSSQTALSLRLMGRGAGELVPAFAAGRAAFEGYGDELERVNGVVRATSVAIADDFDNAQKKFDAAVKGMKISLSDLLLPSLTGIVDGANAAVESLVALQKQMDAMATGATLSFDRQIDSLKKFVLEITAGLPVIGELVKILVALGAIAPLKVDFVGAKGTVPTTPDRFRALPAGSDFRDVVTGTDPNERLSQQKADRAAADAAEKAAADARKKREADAKVAAEALAKAHEKLSQTIAASYLVSERLGASITAALDPVMAEGLIGALQKVIDQSIRAGTELRGVKPLTPLVPNGELPTLELVPPDQDSRLAAALAYLDDIGASVENINDALATQGETWATITLGFEAFGAAMRDALDPARNLIADMSDAAYQFSETFIDSFGTAFEELIVKGHRFRDAFAAFMLSIAKAVGALVKDIVAAIAKALILKAITGGLFSGGGEIASNPGVPLPGSGGLPLARGGSVRLAQGGSVLASAVSRVAAPIARLAAGGSAAFSAPLRLASGAISILPGNPQAFDRIPALLSPGEAVLPTVGGRSPGPLLSGLESLGKDLAGLLARASAIGGGESGGSRNVYNVNLSAIEADGFRGYIRTGSFGREFALASDPARD